MAGIKSEPELSNAAREPKVAYAVHPITKEYIGTTTADPDQLDEDNWLLPAGAYLEVPPEVGMNEKAVMTKSGWIIVQDFRGAYYAKTDGTEIIVDEFGPLPEGVTETPKPTPFHIWSDSGWIVDDDLVVADAIVKTKNERDHKLAIATSQIAPLQDAVDLEDATDKEVSMLKKWKQYRVALNRIGDQPGYPKTIEWPSPPG